MSFLNFLTIFFIFRQQFQLKPFSSYNNYGETSKKMSSSGLNRKIPIIRIKVELNNLKGGEDCGLGERMLHPQNIE